MADIINIDCAAENLLCTEEPNNSLSFDDGFGSVTTDDQTHLTDDQTHLTDDDLLLSNNNNKIIRSESEPLICFLPLLCDEGLSVLFEREQQHLHKYDYLQRLRCGSLDLSVRREAIDWISKARAHYSFGALSFCLAVNYLDRFLSVYEFPKGKAWTSQLLAVGCLSLAAKLEEITVPLTFDLQVGDPKFVFEGKTIERMEILVLSTLKWRILACTPYSFIDYFIRKINDDDDAFLSLITRSIQLILSTYKGIDFLEFKPSEISAAVALCVSGETQSLDIDKAVSSFRYVEKARVLKCLELIKDLKVSNDATNVGGGGGGSGQAQAIVPQSPIGVLDAACFSY